MSAKSQKRLVGWKQYLMTLQDKGLHYIAGIFCAICGALSLIFSAELFFAFLAARTNIPAAQSDADFWILVMSGGAVACGLGAFWGVNSMFRNAKEIAPVALITRHNTGSLPEVETLVRSSDLPPSQQQAKLLRAAGPGREIPAEELLRATTAQRPGYPSEHSRQRAAGETSESARVHLG